VVEHTQIINIGDTDQNADWLKTPENRRTEREIHEQLEREYREQQEEQEPTE